MSATGRIRFRAMIGVVAMAGACLLWAAGAATSAQASTTCTWGGTPAVPTGIFTVSPGLTNLPSSGPSDFTATGHLAGACSGYMTFRGVIGAGATCSDGIFSGTVSGLPGVVRFEGFDLTGIVPSRLYDRAVKRHPR